VINIQYIEENIMYLLVSEWLKARWAERSTWDGTVLIAAGVCFLVFQPVAAYAAWAAIAWGAWTLLKSES
jgi:hypothetical protein